MMTKEQLDEIRARADAATPGPWINDDDLSITGANGTDVCIWWDLVSADDAEFIAAARTDVPALLAEIERLRAEVERVRAEEREACAAILGRVARDDGRPAASRATAEWAAAEIRARGGS